MTPARRVIHAGQALVDRVTEVPHLPERGGNVMAGRDEYHAGGAVNILLAAARSGARAVLAGAHGTGPNGDLVRKALADEGVEVSAPPVPDVDTATCLALVEPTGERTFVTSMGAERRVTASSLQRSEPAAGDVVCISGYSLIEPTRDPILQWVESLPEGTEVVLDPGAVFASLDADVRGRMLARTTVWTSNAQEARELTGVDDPAAACAGVAEQLPEGAVVIVRDGPEGCWVRVDETVHVPGFPQDAVDTNGAGDAHTGVLCAQVVADVDWVEACRRANAGGAIKVTRRGPATAPTTREIDAFLAAH